MLHGLDVQKKTARIFPNRLFSTKPLSKDSGRLRNSQYR